MPVPRHFAADPEQCEEFGYGLGPPTGILILRYRTARRLTSLETRQDMLHQIYWSPDGMLSTLDGFVGPTEAYWARRAARHEVNAADRQTVYRVCLREVPPALIGLASGPVSISAEAAGLIERLTRPGCDEPAALAARPRIMAGLASAPGDHAVGHGTGHGHALTVARALTHDPGDPTELAEWASWLRISVKTLQRDFDREFGVPYSRWRTLTRLRAARALLLTEPVGTVAHRVGYASTSAFIDAFSREYGHTPGRFTRGGLAS